MCNMSHEQLKSKNKVSIKPADRLNLDDDLHLCLSGNPVTKDLTQYQIRHDMAKPTK